MSKFPNNPNESGCTSQPSNIAGTLNLRLQDKEVKSTGTRYPFIDFIRFISMMGIVWAHVNAFPSQGEGFLNSIHISYYIAFKQVFKFSVICFYLSSGFLLAESFKQGSRISYLKKRISSLLKPYVVALGTVLACSFLKIYSEGSDFEVISFFKQIFYITTGTAFWFIPSYLFCILAFALFSKHIQSPFLGATLLAITLITTFITCYTQQFNANHSSGWMAFMLYFWLGANLRLGGWMEKITSLNYGWLLISLVSMYLLASAESYNLYDHHFRAYFNVLRLSNQLYSLIAFALLAKIGEQVTLPPFFNPRKETYGIYLYHTLILGFIYPLIVFFIAKYMHINLYGYDTLSLLAYTLIQFCVCYLLTTLLVKVILKLKLPIL